MTCRFFTTVEVRAVLNFFFVQGKEWFRRFRDGGNDTNNPVPSGPITIDVDKIIEKIHEDRHVTIRNIAGLRDEKLFTGIGKQADIQKSWTFRCPTNCSKKPK